MYVCYAKQVSSHDVDPCLLFQTSVATKLEWAFKIYGIKLANSNSIAHGRSDMHPFPKHKMGLCSKHHSTCLHDYFALPNTHCTSVDYNEDEFIDPDDMDHILDSLTGGSMFQETKNRIIELVKKNNKDGPAVAHMHVARSVGPGASRCRW